MILIPCPMIKPNPWQTRQHIDPDYVRELAADIADRKPGRPATLGLLQVPAGRAVTLAGQPVTETLNNTLAQSWPDHADDIYLQLAYGHNRLAAFHLLAETDPDYARLPVDLVRFTDEEMATAAWSENYQRKNLTAIEEARAIKKMMDDFDLTQAQIAARLHLSPTTISNKLRLLRLPDDVQTAMVQRQVTERQAVAILPALQLPAPALAAAEQTYNKPSNLLESALTGTSSEMLRDEAKRVILRGTHRFDNGYGPPFPLDFHFSNDPDAENEYPLHAERCDQCPTRVKLDDEHRCGDRACFDQKLAFWTEMQLTSASACLHIPRLEMGREDWYGHVEVFYHDSDAKYVPEILEQGCPRERLRVDFSAYGNPGSGYFVPGIPGVRVVCHHGGDGDRCHCLAAKKAAKTRAANEADPATLARQERERQVKALCAPAYDALGTALRAGHEGAWRLLLGQMHPSYKNPSQKWGLVRLATTVAARALHTDLNWHTDRPDRTREIIIRHFEEAGLELPWPDLDGAELIELKLQHFITWIDNPLNWVPSMEVIEGAIDNLSKLQAAAAELPDDERKNDLENVIAARLSQLYRLAEFLVDWSADDAVEWNLYGSLLVNLELRASFLQTQLLKISRQAVLVFALTMLPFSNGEEGEHPNLISHRSALQKRLLMLERPTTLSDLAKHLNVPINAVAIVREVLRGSSDAASEALEVENGELDAAAHLLARRRKCDDVVHDAITPALVDAIKCDALGIEKLEEAETQTT